MLTIVDLIQPAFSNFGINATLLLADSLGGTLPDVNLLLPDFILQVFELFALQKEYIGMM